MSEDIESEKEPIDLHRQRLDFEMVRFEFEKQKTDRQLKLENRRYALERYRSRIERKFLNRNLGILISASISLAAVLVSLGQVWVAKISKDKELEVAAFQTVAEIERLKKQKDEELALQRAEYERQWNLSRAKFITENKQTLFAGSAQELSRMSYLIEMLFPADIAFGMFQDLRSTAESSERKIVWSEAQTRVQERSHVSSNTQSSAPANRGAQPETSTTPSNQTPTPVSTDGQSSTPGKITGVVVSRDRVPLSGAVLELKNEEGTVNSTISDTSGKFLIEVPPGTYSLVVGRGPLFLPTVHSVTVLPASTSVINVTLKAIFSFDSKSRSFANRG